MKNKINRLLLVIRHACQIYRNLTLRRNLAKGDWRAEDMRALLKLLEREREELWVACWELETGRGSAARVAEEAADVSAFAAMIADNARATK